MFFDNDYYEEDADIFAFLEEGDDLGAPEDVDTAVADGDESLGEAYNHLYDFSNVQIAFANYYSEQVIACAQAEANAVVSEDSYAFSEAEEKFKDRAIKAIKGFIQKTKEFIDSVVAKIKKACNGVKGAIKGHYKEFMDWLNGKAVISKQKRAVVKDFKGGCDKIRSLTADIKNLTGKARTEAKGEREAIINQLKDDYKNALDDPSIIEKLSGQKQEDYKKTLKELIKQVEAGADKKVEAMAAGTKGGLDQLAKDLGSSEAGEGASLLGRIISFFAGIIRRFLGAVISTIGFVFGVVKDFVRVFTGGGNATKKSELESKRRYGTYGTNAEYD